MTATAGLGFGGDMGVGRRSNQTDHLPATIDGGNLSGLTIAICTKDRVDFLACCIASVCASPPVGVSFEVLIVNDGSLDPRVVGWARTHVVEVGGTFTLINRREIWGDPPADVRGTSLARVLAMRFARYELITYLDDDVEILPGYFDELLGILRQYPEAIGIGGVNVLSRSAPQGLRKIFERFFLLRSRSPGRLTASAFNWSNDEWVHQPQCFPSEFLLGCNMTLRKTAVEDVTLRAYRVQSLAEDLFLSTWASTRGVLIVNPRMRVLHHFAPIGRRDHAWFWRETVRGHWRVLRIRHRGMLRSLAFVWSLVGLVIGFLFASVVGRLRGDRAHLERSFGSLRGVLRGAWMIAVRDRPFAGYGPGA